MVSARVRFSRQSIYADFNYFGKGEVLLANFYYFGKSLSLLFV